MFSTRVLRRPSAVALVILLVTCGAAPAQTKLPVATAAKKLSRSTEALARVVSPAVVFPFERYMFQLFTNLDLPPPAGFKSPRCIP